MKLRRGLKLSMKSSTNGMKATRPMVTRFGTLVSSRRRLPISLLGGRVQQDDPFTLTGELERRGAGEALAVRNQTTHPPDQPRAGQQRRLAVRHLERDRGVAQIERDGSAPPELQHAQPGVRDGARLPGERPLERQDPILA